VSERGEDASAEHLRLTKGERALAMTRLSNDNGAFEQIEVLEAVLATTEAVVAALDPLDFGSLEQALDARSEPCRGSKRW